MDDARIVGWAHGAFGRSEAEGHEALMAEVVEPALAHAEVAAEDVDAAVVGCFNHGFTAQDFTAALVGMAVPALARVPAVRVENACATGSAALHAALDLVAADRAGTVLVVGVEKMTSVPTATASQVLLGGSYHAEEADVDGGFAGVFAQIATAYAQRHGDPSRALAVIAAKNHTNGAANPLAHLRRPLTVEQCDEVSAANPLVAPPLRRTDCAPITDGAAALVVSSGERAADHPREVALRARSHHNDVLALSRRDPTAFDGARRAWADALGTAGMTLDDLDLVETHDCFTIAELVEYEAMGLAAPGRGADVALEGVTAPDGRLPVNLSGGLKAKGHPIGATGVSMHVLAAMQLTGEAPGLQADDPQVAAVFNMGGAAVANYCSILERTR